MNIEDIKKRLNSADAIYLYCKDGDVEDWEYSDDVAHLFSIIEQAEKDLNEIADSKYITIVTVRKLAEEALQAIRKGD